MVTANILHCRFLWHIFAQLPAHGSLPTIHSWCAIVQLQSFLGESVLPRSIVLFVVNHNLANTSTRWRERFDITQSIRQHIEEICFPNVKLKGWLESPVVFILTNFHINELSGGLHSSTLGLRPLSDPIWTYLFYRLEQRSLRWCTKLLDKRRRFHLLVLAAAMKESLEQAKLLEQIGGHMWRLSWYCERYS